MNHIILANPKWIDEVMKLAKAVDTGNYLAGIPVIEDKRVATYVICEQVRHGYLPVGWRERLKEIQSENQHSR